MQENSVVLLMATLFADYVPVRVVGFYRYAMAKMSPVANRLLSCEEIGPRTKAHLF